MDSTRTDGISKAMSTRYSIPAHPADDATPGRLIARPCSLLLLAPLPAQAAGPDCTPPPSPAINAGKATKTPYDFNMFVLKFALWVSISKVGVLRPWPKALIDF